MTTIYDIARMTGYSAPTVSKALNDRFDVSAAAKAAIRAAAAELGYVANAGAQMLVTRKSYLVGLVYEEDELGLGIEHPLFSGIINSFKRRMEEEGYELLFLTRNLGRKRMSLLEHCRYRGVESILIVNCDAGNPEIREIIDSGLPCVSSNIIFPGLCCVASDNETPSFEAVRYLRSLGHERIAHIAGPDDGPAGAAAERLKAFLRGAALEKSEVCPHFVQRAARWTVDEGKAAMLRLWSGDPRPSAVYCAADMLAFGVLNACRDLGLRVPDDLSVIGFDDSEWAEFAQPPLTTFRQDRAAIGSRSAELMLAMLAGESVPNRESIPVTFMERASCRSVRK